MFIFLELPTFLIAFICSLFQKKPQNKTHCAFSTANESHYFFSCNANFCFQIFKCNYFASWCHLFMLLSCGKTMLVSGRKGGTNYKKTIQFAFEIKFSQIYASLFKFTKPYWLMPLCTRKTTQFKLKQKFIIFKIWALLQFLFAFRLFFFVFVFLWKWCKCTLIHQLNDSVTHWTNMNLFGFTKRLEKQRLSLLISYIFLFV